MTLKGQYAFRDVDRATFGARHENFKEDRRILSATFIAEAKVTIRRHELVYRLSSERKMIDLE